MYFFSIIIFLVLEFPAFLLGLKPSSIKEKLISRHMESKWGKQTEQIDVKLNVEQSEFTRDAWVKDLYTRLFDFLSIFSPVIFVSNFLIFLILLIFFIFLLDIITYHHSIKFMILSNEFKYDHLIS